MNLKIIFKFQFIKLSFFLIFFDFQFLNTFVWTDFIRKWYVLILSEINILKSTELVFSWLMCSELFRSSLLAFRLNVLFTLWLRISITVTNLYSIQVQYIVIVNQRRSYISNCISLSWWLFVEIELWLIALSKYGILISGETTLIQFIVLNLKIESTRHHILWLLKNLTLILIILELIRIYLNINLAFCISLFVRSYLLLDDNWLLLATLTC